MSETEPFTAFADHRLVATGDIEVVARALASGGDSSGSVLIFDATGRPVELDLRHGPEHAVADYRARTAPIDAPPARQGRGRPKLGVVAREVTLLPRHWDWLASQPAGASAALRRLVEEARRAGDGPQRERQAREAAYRVMSALAGDLPGFEEASRALFAGDMEGLRSLAAAWPTDVRDVVMRLAIPA
ncbi:MAG: DUF2239 family protein [Phenylobacterium sp.]|uniref:DUF2239 family protein n=1 Tax=Phenylobacterium sp. TaxID=1871053 RepID=UPI001227E63F|nr:DUF2239 family protein [Phenylobacterium sp.]TAJ70714.1 MAG: DUF2239 family protein [Phenylobacterium sp.]